VISKSVEDIPILSCLLKKRIVRNWEYAGYQSCPEALFDSRLACPKVIAGHKEFYAKRRSGVCLKEEL
jgi:hypothetical protein